MREGSTLIHALLPDTRNCCFEQPLVMPPRSSQNTVIQCFILFFITLGFDFFLEHVALLALLVAFAAKHDRFNPKDMTHHTADVLVTFVAYRAIEPFLFVPIALALAFYQAVLFTRHWVYLCTAAPCRLQTAQDVRNKLGSALATSIGLFPLTAFPSAYLLFSDPSQAWAAWNSYLNYGKGGIRAPGAFHSPAGTHRFRMHLFYVTGAALSLSILHVPVPFLSASSSLSLTLPILLFGPMTTALLIPSLVLAPHFETLGRISHEANV